VGNQKSEDPTLVRLAKKYNRSTEQILIRYCLQKGWVPLPKSDDPEQIAQNVGVYDFDILQEDMATLDGLDQGACGAIME
jgi:diketogulonate reductase-like aldo/keto reductase